MRQTREMDTKQKREMRDKVPEIDTRDMMRESKRHKTDMREDKRAMGGREMRDERQTRNQRQRCRRQWDRHKKARRERERQ